MDNSSWYSTFVKREPSQHAGGAASQSRYVCDNCYGEDFQPGGDGFYYCQSCGNQSQAHVETAAADEDVYGDGALYDLHRRRAAATPTPTPKVHPVDKISRKFFTAAEVKNQQALRQKYGLEDGGDGVRKIFEFVDPDAIADAIRMRYVRGLQMMLQMQCEALVERFSVSPIICGFAGTVWLRYVASRKVFDEEWALKTAKEVKPEVQSKVKEEENDVKPAHPKYRSKYARLPSLRRILPLYSTLAISFLVCHLAREAVLPTDIYKWALEGKLPYLAAFDEIGKVLEHSSNGCAFCSRKLFRPTRLIGARPLEAMAALIAEAVGLRLPPVNTFAIARRYLQELSLPVDKILPHACRLYVWSTPADLWLSSNVHRPPTRACVMAMLIVVIRILYGIHGQGMWEISLCKTKDTCLHSSDTANSTSFSISSKKRSSRGSRESKVCQDTISMKVKKLSAGQSSDLNATELLENLLCIYHSINIRPDYSKDLQSYLNYCKNISFAGVTPTESDKIVIEKLQVIYDKQQEGPRENNKERNTSRYQWPISKTHCAKKPSEGNGNQSAIGSLHEFLDGDEKPITKDSTSFKSYGLPSEQPQVNDYLEVQKHYMVEKMKIAMEEDGFHYLPPRLKQKSDGYLHYKRQRVNGSYIYVAHADYYIVLRACAKLAQVHVQEMHDATVKFEKRLAWLEERIGKSLGLSCESSGELNDNS